MVYRIVPRTEIGLPAVVKSSSGALRPPLHNEPYITAHYTGNNVDYTGRDGAEIVRQIQRVFSTSKPFEYNYCIDQSDDDRIFEFAGKFQAAHSGGENHIAFGVLFINGTMDAITPTQIKKWQWLRDVLVMDGSLQVGVMQRRHKEMPGAATACAGPYVDAVWPQMLQPYEAPTPVTPPTESEDEMSPTLIRYEGHPAVYAQWAGFKTWIPKPDILNAYKLVYKTDVKVIPKGYTALLAASGPIVGPTPSGVDGWGVPVG